MDHPALLGYLTMGRELAAGQHSGVDPRPYIMDCTTLGAVNAEEISMTISPHAGRVTQAVERLSDVLVTEFDDLSPPDAHYVLSVIAFAYMDSFSTTYQEWIGEGKPQP